MEASNLIFPLGVIVVIAICAFAYIIYNMNSKINKLTHTQLSLSQTLQYLVSNSMRQLQPGPGAQHSQANTFEQVNGANTVSTYDNTQSQLQAGGALLSEPMPKIDVSDNSASDESDSNEDSVSDNSASDESDSNEDSESETSGNESNTESDTDNEDENVDLEQNNIQHVAIGDTDNVVSIAAIVDMTNVIDMAPEQLDSNDIDKIININWNQHQQESNSATITEIVDESDNTDDESELDDGLDDGLSSDEDDNNLDEPHNEDEDGVENGNVKTESENETVTNEHEELETKPEPETEAEVVTSSQNKNASSVEAFNNFLISVRKKDQDHNNSKAMRVEEMRKLVVEKNLCSEEEAKRIKKRKLAEMLNLK